MEERKYYCYLMTNVSNSVLYCGITNDLIRRVYEHKIKLHPNSFTSKYNINKLVYFEQHSNAEDAIIREKKIKGGARKRKLKLIESMNFEWKDLSADWYDATILTKEFK